MKVNGKVVVVTGGGNGIGRELVLELLKRGAQVAAFDVSEQGLSETVALAGDGASRLLTARVDISKRASIEQGAKDVVARFGVVDGVINNAGIIQPFVSFEQLSDADVDRVFGVNWFGVLHMTRVFLPLLKARPAAHLVNVSSMGGFLPVPGQTIYGASKAAVKLFTEGLNAELADSAVRVTVVFPGGVATNITGNSGIEMKVDESQKKLLTQPGDAARQIIDGMERDAYRVLVGKDAKAMDAIYRLNPKRAVAFMAKLMKKMSAPAS